MALKFTRVKPVQFLKAFWPIEVTEAGMVSVPMKPVHSENMLAGMRCTLLPMVSVPPQPSNGLSSPETSAQLMALNFTCVKPVQLLKALKPIEVTPVPMFNVPVKPVQLRKAPPCIVVTELGMLSEPVKSVQ